MIGKGCSHGGKKARKKAQSFRRHSKSAPGAAENRNRDRSSSGDRSLQERIQREILAVNGVAISPSLMGAWSRLE
jgi:hypothetical protein